ncbi:hypothetical protein [Bacillus sp. NMCC46]|uniref:hypothetical protein n=1 Tax=Bacillus sp. NMCC46 TaxID=2108538 RepID=UPI001CB96837|nr:hypothetical protein [Bacillus sp. NMCC46]
METDIEWAYVLSVFSFQDVSNPFFDIQPIFLLFLLIMALALINISMLFRFRKIDRSTEVELTGYTKESNIMGIALGFLTVIVIFIFIVIFVLP